MVDDYAAAGQVEIRGYSLVLHRLQNSAFFRAGLVLFPYLPASELAQVLGKGWRL
jgi:hypothetical protein